MQYQIFIKLSLINTKVIQMSLHNSPHTSPVVFGHVRTWFSAALHPVSDASSDLNDLKGLPDHLLLDIGVDPRRVGGSKMDVNAGVDTVDGWFVSPVDRTAAKS